MGILKKIFFIAFFIVAMFIQALISKTNAIDMLTAILNEDIMN